MAVNLVLLGIAATDHGWFALAIASVFGPVANGVMVVILLWEAPAIRRFTGMSVLGHVVFSIIVPSVAAGIDALVILSMEMQGGC